MNESSAGERLNRMLTEAGLSPLELLILRKFEAYLALLLRWNSRTNLTAIQDEDGILRRHFVESIACAMALPQGIGTLLDYGSGGGLPGIPITLCRPEIAVTLAESQGKKAAFLQEAARVLEMQFRVHAGRAEDLKVRFDCVVLRAVDRMHDAVAVARSLVREDGWLVLLSSDAELEGLKISAGSGITWEEAQLLPGSERRVLAKGRKTPK